MSDIIKISKRPTNIFAYSESATVFHTSEEQEKENYQNALHNQYTKGFSDGQKAVQEKTEHEFNEKLKDKIFSNMSERAADLLKEELQFMGMVKLKEVEIAQAKIIDIVKSLEETGEISLNLQGGKEDVYV